MKDEGETRAITLIDRATAALAEAKTVQEAKQVADLAAAAITYGRQVKASQIAVEHAIEIRVRAERLLGAMLAASERAAGARGIGTSAVVIDDATPRLSDLGISRDQSSRAQRLAAIPMDEFEAAVADSKAGSQLSIRRVLTKARRAERVGAIERASRASSPSSLPDRYPVLLADPPWHYGNAKTTSRAIEQHYPTMTLEAIKALEVPATDDAVCYLWATAPKLAEALEVLEAWAFDYRTSLVWAKTDGRPGMGYWARIDHELVLVGVRGTFPPPAEADRRSSVIHAPRGRHSEKPVELYEMIEAAYPTLPRIELFSRAHRPGWAAWGHEAGLEEVSRAPGVVVGRREQTSRTGPGGVRIARRIGA